jgi:hypothetical protein
MLGLAAKDARPNLFERNLERIGGLRLAHGCDAHLVQTRCARSVQNDRSSALRASPRLDAVKRHSAAHDARLTAAGHDDKPLAMLPGHPVVLKGQRVERQEPFRFASDLPHRPSI